MDDFGRHVVTEFITSCAQVLFNNGPYSFVDRLVMQYWHPPVPAYSAVDDFGRHVVTGSYPIERR